MPGQKKPTKADLLAAAGKTLRDLIAPNLKVLFCGINPGLYSGYTGTHFARPGNRFWPTLFAAGFTDRLLSADEEQELLTRHLGITSLVERATAGAAELTSDELTDGGSRLLAKAREYKPHTVAVLGISAYRTAFRRSRAELGRQPDRLADSALWVLPNPSGLNAHYTPSDLARIFRDFRLALDAESA